MAIHQDSSGKAKDLHFLMRAQLEGVNQELLKLLLKMNVKQIYLENKVFLCGGLVELIKNGYETLVEAGYSPRDGIFRMFT